MLGNAFLKIKQKQKLAPTPAQARPDGAGAVVVDDQTVWTGRPFEVTVENKDGRLTFWYRIYVTNLDPGDYALSTSDGTAIGEGLIPLLPGGRLVVTGSVGAADGAQPSGPRPFEVRVYEFATPDENGPNRFAGGLEWLWIPTPQASEVAVSAAPETVKVRPWQRQAHFDIAVANRSYLPVAVALRVAEAGDGKAGGQPAASGVGQKAMVLNEPLPPLEERTLDCSLAVAKLKAPVDVGVAADIEVEGVMAPFTASAPQPVHVVPVPLLRAWQDWVVAAIGAFLLVWLLFGMPPWVHPRARVVLTFDGGPAQGMQAQDLELSLAPADLDQKFPTRVGRPVTSSSRDRFEYLFDWGRTMRGFRWGWHRSDLRLSIKVLDEKRKPLYQDYDFADRRLGNAVITTHAGVSPGEIPLLLTTQPGIIFRVNLANTNHLPEGDEINLSFLVDGQVKWQGKFGKGAPIPPIRLPDDAVSGNKPTSVTIRAEALPSTLEASRVVAASRSKDPYAVDLTFAMKGATVSIPVGEPPAPFAYVVKDPGGQVIKSGSSQGAVQVDVPMSSAARNVLVNVSCGGKLRQSKIVALKPGATTDLGAWKSSDGAPPEGNPPGNETPPGNIVPIEPPPGGGGGNPPAAPETPKLAAEDVQKWCMPLGLAGATKRLVSASANAATLQIAVEAVPPSAPEFTLNLTPTQACWVQVYDVNLDINKVKPLLARDGGFILVDEDPWPWTVKAGETKSIPIRKEAGEDHQYVVLAVVAKRWQKGADLKDQLRRTTQGELSAWAIGGTW